jgi:hypothetical protein
VPARSKKSAPKKREVVDAEVVEDAPPRPSEAVSAKAKPGVVEGEVDSEPEGEVQAEVGEQSAEPEVPDEELEEIDAAEVDAELKRSAIPATFERRTSSSRATCAWW